MSYKISSSKFSHPLLKPILGEIYQYFNETGINFYVIGATARDILMEVHNEKSTRATHDLDIAIAISSWEQYEEVENGLLSLANFTKEPHQKQRFIYRGKFELDIVPYGQIMKDNEKIFWPPDESFAMTVLGFTEVEKHVESIRIDEGLEIKVVSLAGIFLLKIIAWKDRNHKTNKDADDMAFILENYLSIHEEKALENYEEIYDAANFTTLTAGAKLLGADLLNILKGSETTLSRVKSILKAEIHNQEQSNLINQIIETNRIAYDQVLACLQNIYNKLQ